MKYLHCIFALIVCSMQAIGQTFLPDMTMERDFAAQVKSIDEFMARFNGEELKPNLCSDSIRRDNIIHLFDFQMSHNGLTEAAFKNLILDFSRTALGWNSKLSINAKGTFAEAKCEIKYNGKKQHIVLLMRREKTNKGSQKWAIAGVKGLKEMGLYSDKRMTISPVDHETHFMSLQDFFNANHNIVPSMRSNDKEIDELSMFLGLCIAKSIEFVQVDDLKFHFTDMPKYIFVVEEINREGTNSGWLITDITHRNTPSDQKNYIDTLFGNKK